MVSQKFPLALPPAILCLTQVEASSDPNVLTGTPCCPGVVEGVVRVVTSIQQTQVRAGVPSMCSADPVLYNGLTGTIM